MDKTNTDRRTDRPTDIQATRHTDRETYTHTDIETYKEPYIHTDIRADRKHKYKKIQNYRKQKRHT